MQDKSSSNENQLTGQEKLFIGYFVFYAVCIAVLLLSTVVKDICISWPECKVRIEDLRDFRKELFGFIAGACTFLIAMDKYVNDPEKYARELPLGLVGGIAGFGAVFLLVEDAGSYAQAALLFLAWPVFCSLYLWMRHLYPKAKHSAVGRWTQVEIIWIYPFTGFLIALRLVAGMVHHFCPALRVEHLFITSTAISLIIVLLLRWAFIRHN